MPLQNRVDPFGRIQANPARGLFTGNRGVIHDPATRTLLARRWTTKAWIICACAFRGRRRTVMGRNAPSGGVGWTELFFLDEVTALASGHRPCFFCRREAAVAFAQAFAQGRGMERVSAPEMDARLHATRLAATAKQAPLLASPETLPDGAMIAAANEAFAVRRGRLLPWDFAGYGLPIEPAALSGPLSLLTPEPTLKALAAGFSPVWHPSAGP